MSSGYLRQITLRGELGARFGREHWLDVATPAEAVRALDANHPGFLQYVASLDGVADFAVILGGDSCLDASQGDHPLGRRGLELVPVVRGAGDNGGVWSLVAGVVLIAVVSILTWGVGTVALSAALGGAISAGTLSSALLLAGAIGVSLVLSGVAQMVAGTPKTSITASERAQDSEKLASYQFSGPVNTAGQGNPVPVVYGELIVGSQVISMGIQTA